MVAYSFICTGVFAAVFVLGMSSGGGASTQETRPVLARDDFRSGLVQWVVEADRGGKIEATDGALTVDVAGGCTLWFKKRLEGPVVIEYEATVVKAGGPNDRGSDLNCFWMATDARSPDDLFATKRSGKFADYDQLRCYYVGYGGNNNTTTRFRRYIGEKDNRPLLPEHDLKAPEKLIKPNHPYRVRLVADGEKIQYWRDDELIFDFKDPEPYRSGYFALRTVDNHLVVKNFRVSRPADPR